MKLGTSKKHWYTVTIEYDDKHTVVVTRAKNKRKAIISALQDLAMSGFDIKVKRT